MKHNVIHQPELHRFIIEEEGAVAYAEYSVVENAECRTFDIIHTIVPEALRGQGLASELVENAYEYAGLEGMKIKASCSYASAWLQRHAR